MYDKKKILVLMSGGVDSSTAAALLVRDGYDVAGVYLKLWEVIEGGPSSEASEDGPPNIGDPCWALEMKDAARVAAKLGIPFTVWDVTEEYKTRVLENFYSEYAAGRTPNPDVLCNSEIKFGIALDRALAAGYEFVATGHYARLQREIRNSKFEIRNLLEAVDKNKDQSYFLWRLTQEQLAHVMFPIGEYTKPEVRALAEKFGLHNAEKKDSQGVCFLGKIDLKEFLYRRSVEAGFSLPHGDLKVAATLTQQSGPILDVHGTLLGMHDGLAHFTIGQRHGTKLGGTGPYFVVEKDTASNTLIVANEEEEVNYRAVECSVQDMNWIGDVPKEDVPLMARTRYRASLMEVRIMNYESGVVNQSLIPNSKSLIHFKVPARAVAPGQSIVFYEGDKVIGGGVIDEVTLLCKAQKFAHVS